LREPVTANLAYRRPQVNFSKIFGLPAHPLFVHVPIVLIPLTGIGAIAMSFSARVRDRYGWLVLAIAIVAGVGTQLAIESGHALRHSVPRSAALARHVHIASTIRPLILLLFLVALATMLIDRRSRGAWPFAKRARGRELSLPLRVALIVLTLVVAVGTNVRLFQIGDSGAKATWQRVHLRSDSARNRSSRK
jgi:hypothetical protein